MWTADSSSNEWFVCCHIPVEIIVLMLISAYGRQKDQENIRLADRCLADVMKYICITKLKKQQLAGQE